MTAKATTSDKAKETADQAIARGDAVDAKTDAPAKAKFVPKIIKHVTLPLIKPIINVPVYIKVTGTMFIGKDISARVKKGEAEEKKKAPATLMNCINLETGEESQIIVPSVLKGILEDDYTEHNPDGSIKKDDAGNPVQSYVGKGFSVTKQEKREGKDYFPFSVAEIAVD